jgi:RimJ/RimL family protein N-acetyltransferase/pimeloyl-ACP methyl ester carboxylesterase
MSVGFRARIVPDPARRYALAGVDDRPRARPVLCATWYPAEGDGTAMSLGSYCDPLDDDAGYTAFAAALVATAAEERCRLVTGVGSSVLAANADAARQYRALLDAPVAARRSATPRAGRFPLVIYHPGLGGSFTEHTPLFERLAAAGHVVVASAYQPAHGAWLTIESENATSVQEIATLIRIAVDDGIADADDVSVIGHSYGAEAAMIARLEIDAIRRLVVLDSTLDYDAAAPLAQPGAQRMSNERRRLTVPMLVIASSGAEFSLVRRFAYCDRHLISLGGMRHNDFVDPLPSRFELLSNPESDAASARLDAYELIGDATLAFLASGDDGRALALEPLPSVAVRYELLVAEAAPPSEADLIALAEAPATWVTSACERFIASPEDLPTGGFVSRLGYSLLRASRVDDSVEVMRLACRLEPKSHERYEALGDALVVAGDRVGAADAYRTTLALINSTPGIAESARIELGTFARRALVDLERRIERPVDNVLVVRARPRDASALHALFLALDVETKFMLFEPDERPVDPGNLAETIETRDANDGGAFFIALDGDDLIGFVSVTRYSRRRTRHGAMVAMGVRDAYTGRGIGRRLLESVDGWARSVGVRRLALTVMEHNARAIGLYERCGYVVEGRERDSLIVDGVFVDLIAMAKTLD